MKETTNYKFKKPELTDSPPDITVMNPNWDAIDTELKERDTRVGPLGSLITRIKTSIVNALNGLQQDFDEHKADFVSQTRNVTRDMSLTGIQTISSLLGKPKAIHILANVGNAKKMCVGFWSSSGLHVSIYSDSSNGNYLNSNAIMIADNVSNRTQGVIKNVTNNSFDIDWTHYGTGATGTANMMFLVTYHGGA